MNRSASRRSEYDAIGLDETFLGSEENRDEFELNEDDLNIEEEDSETYLPSESGFRPSANHVLSSRRRLGEVKNS